MMAFILSLLLVLTLIFGGMFFQLSRYRQKYRKLAEALCDPGTCKIDFYLRILTLKGKVEGLPVRYSVFGDERGGLPVSSYLLLEYPVRTNLRIYPGGDLNALPPELGDALHTIQETPDFRGLVLTPEGMPFLARFLSRPLGLGYRPGVLLWRWGTAPFDSSAVKKDFEMLVDAVKQGI